jgi:HSP20 family protein
MNRIMMSRPVFKNIPQAHSHMQRQYHRNRHAGTNILKTNDGFEIQLAVPGIDKSQLEIFIEEDVLQIGMKAQNEDKKLDYKLKQFDFSNFTKRFELSEEIDQEQIDAVYENGILRIKLTKSQLSAAERIRKIDIK